MAQPKRFALLAYLASADATARHPRDILLDLFWPDLGPVRARRALRQALHGLRRSLGPDVLTGKGREMIGTDPDRLWCDAVAFTRAIDEGRDEDALELYRGPFLDGFHIDGAPRFDRWVEGRRRELHRMAVEAAWRLADRAEGADRGAEAGRWAELAVKLAPYDSAGVQRLMRLLQRTDRSAAALRAYEDYAARLRRDLELTPPEEISVLADRLAASAAPGDEGGAGHGAPEPAVASPGAAPPEGSGAAPDRRHDGAAGPPANGEELGSRLPRALAAVAGLLILALMGLAAASWLRDAETAAAAAPPPSSVAVLRFADLSPGGDQAWFADGVAEEILDALASVRGLDVKGRSSSFQFGHTNPDVRMVGDSLGVGSVLEGSVRRMGDRVRITVQLVRSSDASHLWSETYVRALTPEAIFQVQEDVAHSVAAALQVELGLDEAQQLTVQPPADLEAYGLYLQARHALRQRSAEGRTRARILVDRALERDSTYAPAWALKARVFLLGPFWEGVEGIPPLADARAEALEASRRALELGRDLAVVHLTRGLVLDFLHRWDEGHYHHQRAIELNPGDPDARSAYLWHLASLGRWDRALEQARHRQRLDPLYTPANGNLAEMLMYGGHFEEAEVQWDHTVALASHGDAHASFVRLLRAKVHALEGDLEQAVRRVRSAREAAGDTAQPSAGYYLSHLGAAEGLAGNVDAAAALLDSVRSRWSEGLPPPRQTLRALDVARIHASLGAIDSAFVWLDRSRPEIWRSLETARFRGDPWWEPIRGDPRHLEVLERTGTVGIGLSDDEPAG